MPDLSRVPPTRFPFDRLYDRLPEGSPLRSEILATATYAAPGPQYPVNAPDPAGEKGVASAELADGRAIVVWTDTSDLSPDPLSGLIYGRFLDAAGNPIGAEFKLTSGSLAEAFNSFEVGALSNGGFVIVWAANDATGGTGRNVMAQIFSSSGAPVGAEFQVNANVPSNQYFPAVTGLDGGGFVVTWVDQARDPDYGAAFFIEGIKARIYFEDGQPLGGEIQVNSTPTQIGGYPAIDALENGGFVISWTGRGTTSGVDVLVQTFDASGAKLAGQINVDSAPRMNDQHSDVIGTDDGGFIVIWRQLNQDTGVQTIRGLDFDSPADTSGSAFVVATSSGALDVRPSIAELDNGFVVVFETGEAGYEDVNARVFRAWDDPAGDAFLVPTKNEFRQFDSEVIPLGNGFLVSWNDSLDTYALEGNIDVRPFFLDWG